MQEQWVQRRLAAILAAEVAGYTRLTGADEEGTIARLRALRRELIDPAIASGSGRIVKTTGNGILIEFASVTLRTTSMGWIPAVATAIANFAVRSTLLPLGLPAPDLSPPCGI